MSNLISILIPLYNSERWIAETIRSAINQTWKNIEIIVVDDGSSDNSAAIARSFSAKNLKVISQENQGASAARNHALNVAQGDFIQYLDADDLLSPNKIESQLRVLEQNPPRMLAIVPTVYFYDQEGTEKGKQEVGKEFIDSNYPLDWLIELLGPEKGSMVPVHSWLVPREVADDAGMWDEHPSPDDDGEYFVRVVLASAGIRCVEAGVCYYRKHRTGGSWSGGGSKTLQWGALRSLNLKAQHILTLTNEPRAKRTLARLYMDRAFTAYPNYPDITDLALKRVEELGGTNYTPPPGGWRASLLQKTFGWKKARKISERYYRYAARFKSVLEG